MSAKIMAILLLATGLAACAGTSASDRAEPGAAAARDYPLHDPDAKPRAGVFRTARGEVVRCEKEKSLNSHVPLVQCRTEADIDEDHRKASAAMDRINNQTGIVPPVD